MQPIDSEELYRDGLHYDALNNFDYDIPFWIEQCKNAGSVLELACGTGRITIPIAESGAEITGVDISEGMMKRAKEKAGGKNVNINFIRGDYRTLDLGKKFNVILCPFNAFQHLLDLESLLGFFDVVKRHFKPDGKFVFDIFNPDLNLLLNKGEKYFVQEYDNPYNPGEKVILNETKHYDKVTQINHVMWTYTIGKENTTYPLNMRVFYPAEMDNYIIMNGFEILHKYGSFDKEDFKADSGKQIYVCKFKDTL